MFDPRHYTTWSNAGLVGAALCAALAHRAEALPARARQWLASAACALLVNMLVVGLLGAYVLAYHHAPAAPPRSTSYHRALNRTYFWQDALPAFASALALVRVATAPRGSVWAEARGDMRGLLAVFGLQAAYALTPYRGHLGVAKVRAVYGQENPWLLLLCADGLIALAIRAVDSDGR